MLGDDFSSAPHLTLRVSEGVYLFSAYLCIYVCVVRARKVFIAAFLAYTRHPRRVHRSDRAYICNEPQIKTNKHTRNVCIYKFIYMCSMYLCGINSASTTTKPRPPKHRALAQRVRNVEWLLLLPNDGISSKTRCDLKIQNMRQIITWRSSCPSCFGYIEMRNNSSDARNILRRSFF